LFLLVYAYVPNAAAIKAATTMTTINDENSAILVGAGVGVGNVIALLVGTQIGSMATPLVMGVYESVVEV
jgi:hypothetical protein